jgi:hypothetical protein
MLLLNLLLSYSTSWHVALNSDMKHSMHCKSMHDVVAMHDVGVHSVGVYCMSLHSMDVLGDKKTIFNAHLRKKANFLLLYVAQYLCRLKAGA